MCSILNELLIIGYYWNLGGYVLQRRKKEGLVMKLYRSVQHLRSRPQRRPRECADTWPAGPLLDPVFSPLKTPPQGACRTWATRGASRRCQELPKCCIASGTQILKKCRHAQKNVLWRYQDPSRSSSRNATLSKNHKSDWRFC